MFGKVCDSLGTFWCKVPIMSTLVLHRNVSIASHTLPAPGDEVIGYNVFTLQDTVLLFKYVDTRGKQVEIVHTRHSLLNYAAEID